MTVDSLRVAFAFSPPHDVPVGRLALDGNTAIFEYAESFAHSRLALNPVFAPIVPGLVRPRDPRTFRGLHGVFADSLPDAWGRLLLERQLRRERIAITELTVLDRLALIGRRGRGALVYEPASVPLAGDRSVDIDELAQQSAEVLAGEAGVLLGELERLGGSSGGARPKVQVALDDSGRARSADEELPPGFTSWIVKFHGTVDRFADIGPLEAAYAEAARQAGIDMPRTRLIPARSGPGYFATERFDRAPHERRLHMLSIAGMLDADWSIPSLDYDGVIEAVRAATRDERAVHEMFRRMVFNVLAHNRDDHAKQHALLLGPEGGWRLSPAFDLTFSAGPGNVHYLAVNGRGNDITRPDLLAVAKRQSIAIRRANATIDEVAAAVAALPSIARRLGVTRASLAEMKRASSEQLALAGYRGSPSRSYLPSTQT